MKLRIDMQALLDAQIDSITEDVQRLEFFLSEDHETPLDAKTHAMFRDIQSSYSDLLSKLKYVKECSRPV
jgi:hypothetical protein